MIYKNIVQGIFIERPNRFIAICQVDNEIHKCHVKNTGRCRELLVKNATVYLEKNNNPNRKTSYSLIAVEKPTDTGIKLINMDSQAPNVVYKEFLQKGSIFYDTIDEWVNSNKSSRPTQTIRSEVKYKNSRFDFLVQTGQELCYIETKGVTLEHNGIASFPDAPTERGIKHVEELIEATQEGYKTAIVFIIQMSGIKYFRPNYETHEAFGVALIKARKAGVSILAYDCLVTSSSLDINKIIEVRL